MSSSVSAIVLAAGSASRMGSQKQLLRLGAQTLLEHTLESVRASQVGEIVVVLGAAAEAIRPHIPDDKNVRVVVNDDFQAGMGRSLQRGLAELNPEASAALVVLADQPLVKAETLNRLIEEYGRHKPQILIPLFRGFRVIRCFWTARFFRKSPRCRETRAAAPSLAIILRRFGRLRWTMRAFCSMPTGRAISIN